MASRFNSPALAINGGAPVRTRPFPSWPVHNQAEIDAVAAVAASGKWWRCAYSTSELGHKDSDQIEGRSRVEVFEERFARAHGARYAVAVTSGTAALEIAMRAAGIQPGDEVITTPYTFIATSKCIMNQLAVPVYTDIEPASYNMDVSQVESLITDRTRAILPVHFSGNVCDMETINTIAKKHKLAVIEDAAHAHGVELDGGRYAGTLGDMGCFSFQESKNVATGEGGMLLTNDERLYGLAFSLHHLGRLPGELWYKHFHLGWNYRMNEFTAAIGIVQLGRLFEQNARRMENYRYLTAALAGIPGITPCRNHPGITKHSHHLVMLRYDAEVGGLPRERLIAALQAEGIPCLAGYTFPNYANPFMTSEKTRARYAAAGITIPDYAAYASRCPHTERACYREAVWLEHRLLLGERNDMDDIVAAFAKLLG